MPFVSCKVMAGVLTGDQKVEIARGITDAFVAVGGEPVRGVTWVTIEEVHSGAWTMAGEAITTETLEAELAVRRGRLAEAEARLEHAFALGCRLADPCWEGAAARATALLHARRGDPATAGRWLADARVRVTRVADPYQWMHGAVLDTAADVAIGTGDPEARPTARALEALASRTGMRELVVRAQVHRARLGEPGALDAARALAAAIDNPLLGTLVA